MKTKKVLNGQKKEEKNLNTSFTELSEDTLDLVIGGVSAEGALERLNKLSGGMKIQSTSVDPSGYQICNRE